jgi:hypothetical protein
MIVCWAHNWENCLLEVIELRKELQKWRERGEKDRVIARDRVIKITTEARRHGVGNPELILSESQATCW